MINDLFPTLRLAIITLIVIAIAVAGKTYLDKRIDEIVKLEVFVNALFFVTFASIFLVLSKQDQRFIVGPFILILIVILTYFYRTTLRQPTNTPVNPSGKASLQTVKEFSCKSYYITADVTFGNSPNIYRDLIVLFADGTSTVLGVAWGESTTGAAFPFFTFSEELVAKELPYDVSEKSLASCKNSTGKNFLEVFAIRPFSDFQSFLKVSK